MNKSVILIFLVFAALVGLCVGENININVCGGDSCCPNNTSLKCCCETYNVDYLAVKKRVSFSEALIHCRQIGMDLATITTATEENALTEYLKSVTSDAGYDAGFWIGATKWLGSTDFYWVKTGEPVIYSDWLPGQPDLDSELCLEWLIYGVGNGKIYGWNNYNCNVNLAYVCQTRRHCI